MSKKNQIIPIGNIQGLIFTIRNVQVMINRDLACLYGVEVKRLNEEVKRNITRFPKEFRFQLNDMEKNELVANCDRFEKLKYSSVNLYAFTKAHDRFLIIDENTMYHFGASLKDLGKKWFAFSKMDIKAMEMITNLRSLSEVETKGGGDE